MRAPLIVALALFAGCADSSESGGGSASDDAGARAVRISAAEYSREWPFTVDEGVLRCEGSSVIFRAEGTDYAVNGTARSEYPGIEPIWKKDPDVPGTRINIGDVLDRGLELCD